MSSRSRTNRDTVPPTPDRQSKKEYRCTNCVPGTRMLPWDADETVRIGCQACDGIHRHVRSGSVASWVLAAQRERDDYVR